MQFASVLHSVALVCALCVARPGIAQERGEDATYPSKAVKVVVPYAPGGFPDTITRIIGQRLAETLGQQFIVENRGGAGGIAGCEAVARASPDGYTLLMASEGQIAINPAIYSKLPYDSIRDFTPISKVAISPLFLAVHASVPVKTFAELVALVKSKPGELTYGSSGTGSIHHITMEAMKAALGLDIVHVPYKGSGQSVPALIGGQVSMSVAALPSLVAHMKAGRVRLLAANTASRSPQARDVPTIAELGTPGFDYPATVGLLGPAGMSRGIVQKLYADIVKAVNHPDTLQRFAALGVDPVGGTPEAYAAGNNADIERYVGVVKAARIKAD
jgi:tripartite-type tricarboxylate transporter receptor subunit TctC